jgi:hypothetical protein
MHTPKIITVDLGLGHKSCNIVGKCNVILYPAPVVKKSRFFKKNADS